MTTHSEQRRQAALSRTPVWVFRRPLSTIATAVAFSLLGGQAALAQTPPANQATVAAPTQIEMPWNDKNRPNRPPNPVAGRNAEPGVSIHASISEHLVRWGRALTPPSLAQRAAWEIHGLFAVWAAALAWAVVRPARRAGTELRWLGATLLASLPLLHALTTERHLLPSLWSGNWGVAGLGLELSLLALAALHARWALRIHRLSTTR